MTADDGLCDLGATELVHLVATRQASAREVMDAFLTRIDALNPTFNAIVTRRDPDELVAEADAADRAVVGGEPLGALHGLPIAVKDTTETAGIRTTYGSPLLAELVPTSDSLAAGRVRAAGAIVIGKTNVPEFGLGSHTYNTIFGRTGNAWNPSFSAGGSSGGAAVAVAQRMLPVADGSDLGGSIRNPAAWNNLFGIRPSQGLVPARSATDAFWSQLVTEGPLARDVADLALLLRVQAGYDPAAPLSRDPVPPGLGEPFDADVAGRRIAWLGDLDGHLALEDGVRDVCEAALGLLDASGVHVDPLVPAFDWEELWRSFVVLRQFGLDAELGPLFADDDARALMKPELQWELIRARALTIDDLHQAIATRSAWYHAVLAAFEDHDYLALPAAQLGPFPLATDWPTRIGGRDMDSYHRWMEVAAPGTLSGCPVVSLPAGFDDRGLPNGVQVIGRPRDDRSLLELARHVEPIFPWVGARPPEPG